LNPAYNASEVKFYVEDASSKLLLVHKGAIKDNAEAVKAARELGVAVAEIWYDAKKKKVGISLDSKDTKSGRGKRISDSGKPKEDDVALLLHTSGTTGRPKAVPLVGNLCLFSVYSS
jgi:long-subunit acyl-CoA synthetase (AMP-forming)